MSKVFVHQILLNEIEWWFGEKMEGFKNFQSEGKCVILQNNATNLTFLLTQSHIGHKKAQFPMS